MSKQHSDRQSRDFESTNFLAESITYLRSETEISEQAEEQEVSSPNVTWFILSLNHYQSLEDVSYHSSTFGRFFKLLDFYSDSSSKRFVKKSRENVSTIYERKQANEVFECDDQTFEYHSNVDKPCAAVDREVMSNQHTDRQNRDNQSMDYLS
jgi:hypothetical protein